jgi:arsenate reductase
MGDTVEVYSAGIKKRGLDPLVIRVMAEAGVDISGHRSKLVSELQVQQFDWVVILCSNTGKTCPYFPGRIIHGGFDDPSQLVTQAGSEEEALDQYRRVRDEIRDFVLTLPEIFRTRENK